MFKRNNWFEFKEFTKFLNDKGNAVLFAQLGSLGAVILIGLIYYLVDMILKSKK